MGQTGAGLEDADKIIEGTELHTKWDEIKESCPWFFEMRSLIGERPNIRPVGIGNNDSDIDTSLLLRGDDQDDQDHNASTPDLGGTDTDHDMYDPKSDGDSDDDAYVKRGKRKRSPTAAPTVPKAPPKKKTKPQAAISTPAPATHVRHVAVSGFREPPPAALTNRSNTTAAAPKLTKRKATDEGNTDAAKKARKPRNAAHRCPGFHF
ncbi:hypothetical protein B0H10DRAFT_2236563 [Mycena sp. CBHHK59/15]|nr:hypothetical protein B0H10DRAFT_2236563 [Mycena sp. CBHHK59/15]